MKKFLTKNEACLALKQMTDNHSLTRDDLCLLTSIRVCLASEEDGISLWGMPIEDVRPLFRSCEEPDENASDDIIANYEAYKARLADTYEKLSKRGVD